MKLEHRKLSQHVMQNPSKEVRSQLELLHQNIKTFFGGINDKDIISILSLNASTTHGGFWSQIQRGPDLVKFKEFLAMDPKAIKSSRLITGLQTITSALGMILCKKELEADSVLRDIGKFVSKFAVRRISEIYQDKKTGTQQASELSIDIIIEPADSISDASDIDDDNHQPQCRTPKRRYPIDSWVGRAREKNIEVRANVSGTTPLTLAAVAAMQSLSTETNIWFSNDENASKLAAVLVIATFCRADYHSIAESAAGIYHFLTERNRKINPQIVNEGIEPQQAEEFGLGLLDKAKQHNLGIGMRHAFFKMEPNLLTEMSCTIQFDPR